MRHIEADWSGYRHAPPGADADARAGGLTPRELQVAALVAKGHSNRDIAKEFVLSERTIETHVQNTLTKLAFSSRVELLCTPVTPDTFALRERFISGCLTLRARCMNETLPGM